MENVRKKTIHMGDFLGNTSFEDKGPKKSFGQRRNDGFNRRPNKFAPRREGGNFEQRPKQTGFVRTQREGNAGGFNRPNSSSFGRGPRRFNRFGDMHHSTAGHVHFGNRRRFGGRRGGNKGPKIDVNMFVNKASEKTHEESYVPKNKFTDFKIDERLKKNIVSKGFTNPTPIQDQSIPSILEGRDLVGLANTGTGKTGAFLIPLINKILQNKNHKVLIIAPTRELSMQIEQELKGLTKFLNIWSQLVIGGASMQRQLWGLRKFHNFVVGTPGRLKDLIERGYIKTETFGSLVLDEVDRMLDMGFIDDIRFIVAKIPKDKQSLFFSATLSREIEGLINQFLNDPVKVMIKTRPTSENVDQDIIRLKPGETKMEVLSELLKKEEEFKKVLIFTRTKRAADQVGESLYRKGFRADSIHGDKTQYRRQVALQRFKDGKTNILVATDVAARGLDIKEVSHVINYDQPENYDDYIHRIGRTGRADKKGVALTFVE